MNKIHLIGGSKKKEEPKEEKTYTIRVKITDRQMKPKNLDFTKTTERVSFEEELQITAAGNELDASLGATTVLNRWWPIKKFDIDILSMTENKIVTPKLIVV